MNWSINQKMLVSQGLERNPFLRREITCMIYQIYYDYSNKYIPVPEGRLSLTKNNVKRSFGFSIYAYRIIAINRNLLHKIQVITRFLNL